MKFDTNNLKWTREPEDFTVTEDKIEIITKPHTDFVVSIQSSRR